MMKKTLISLTILLYTQFAFAQDEKPITKNNIILGGGFSGGYISEQTVATDSPMYPIDIYNRDMKYFSISFIPEFSIFLIDNFAVGLSLNASYHHFQAGSRYTTLGIGPVFTYYFNNGLLVGMTTYGSLSFVDDMVKNISALEINPYVGYAWFINSKISIEPRLNYSIKYSDYYNQGIDYTVKEKVFFSFTISKFL